VKWSGAAAGTRTRPRSTAHDHGAPGCGSGKVQSAVDKPIHFL